MATSSLSRCPIEDVLPWISSSSSSSPSTATTTQTSGNTILVADRVETTGRFLLFVTTAAALRQKQQQRVLWLSFNGAYTIDLIKQGLKKMGCLVAASAAAAPATTTIATAAAPSFLFTDATQRLTIRAVAQEMAQGLISKEWSPNNEFNAESFVRNLYLQVQEWLQQNQQDDDDDDDEPALVLLDDVSALADLVGPSLAYALVYQVRARIRCQTRLLVRCAGDAFEHATKTTTTTTDEQTWIGAGAAASNTARNASASSWESSLVELADWMVDVLPLQSGYSREAHGRLLLTPRSSNTTTSPMRCNYCLTDQAAFAIRLTTKTLG